MWNPFKKKAKTDDIMMENSSIEKNILASDDKTDIPKMGMLQAMAMKRIAKMNPQERNKIMQDAMKPENRAKIMGVMEKMKSSGQVTEAQIAQAKKMLGM